MSPTEQTAALARVVESARTFVATADEFLPEQPEAVSEDLGALIGAVDGLAASAGFEVVPGPWRPGWEKFSTDEMDEAVGRGQV